MSAVDAPQFSAVAESADHAGAVGKKVERSLASFAPRYQRYVVKARSYTQQYSHIYNKRLAQMRDLVRAAAHRKWQDGGSWRECTKVIDLRPDAPAGGSGHGASSGAGATAASGAQQQWVVVGCLYKDQPLKPSVLDEYSGDRGLEAPVPRANYASAEDSLVLEDESGRVALCAGLWTPPQLHASAAGSSASSSGAAAGRGGAKRRRTLQHPGSSADAADEADADGFSLSRAGASAVPFPLARIVARMVTGVVVAVRGTVLEMGELAVCDLCVPGLVTIPPSAAPSAAAARAGPLAVVPRPLPGTGLLAAAAAASSSSSGAGGGVPPSYVLLVCGLGFGGVGNAKAGVLPPDYALSLHLLSDFISGMSGGPGDAAASARIARVVVAGNLLAPAPSASTAASRSAAASASYVRSTSGAGSGSGGAGASGSHGSSGGGGSSSGPSFTDRSLSVADQELLSAPMREADAWLSTLAAGVPVDVLPGEHDPANFTLPQQPMHPCLFPASARYATFRSVTNPYDADLGGVRFTGSSGQPVIDVARYVASSGVIHPGDEGGLQRSALSRRSRSRRAGAGAGAGAGGSAGAAAGAVGDGDARRSAAMRMDDDADAEGAADPAVAAAVGSTTGDRALSLIAGTGAGAGHEARMGTVGIASAAALMDGSGDEADGDELDAGAGAAAGASAGSSSSESDSEGDGAEDREARAARLKEEPLSILRHVDILTNTLYWRHLAPTCPDTLASYPFFDVDPFALDPSRLPHVLFAGGAGAFATRLVRDPADPVNTQVRVISVPDFCRSRTAVLVDISRPDLPAQAVSFRAM